ncbi:response regulator [Stakelama sp. CBK3Z-3]|uniref:histidine kinase n=1 Tax=Stakelama flava TaxID=2860338 RepID=A0ABS6XKZ4_9SPHN|nr:response regulator [Stakelama flava]MBW4330877.1 response regulator [Stakelama flava]
MATLPAKISTRAAAFPYAVTIACGVAAALIILTLLGNAFVAAGFAGASLVIAGAMYGWHRMRSGEAEPEVVIDWALANLLAEASSDAVAVTDRAGRLVCANSAYQSMFGGYPTPPALPLNHSDAELASAGRAAWRDGLVTLGIVLKGGVRAAARIERTGGEMLVWRFTRSSSADLPRQVETLIGGDSGDRLGSAGIMAVSLSPDGRIRAANRVFRLRATGKDDSPVEGRDFARFLATDGQGLVRFEREAGEGTPLRVLQIPFVEGEGAPMLIALLDEEDPGTPAQAMHAAAHVRSLISLLPVGMALVDRNGRFLHMNDAFTRAADVSEVNPPLYPGDLVVRDDKGPLADVIRRFANGAAHSADIAIRLKNRGEEAVQLSVAGARGLGDAAVLLTLKDSGEETRLKRQVAQATKMQAVGQLAGGVAHDFNNILTAILGHCDLMLMRHSPGDSDYDDIQQIRANSNRAASLTRQLLAFSRQQTLRPQVLQLPDVISEVSNLLKRLLGETVQLVVQHGRNLGPVRADPGQLEQVVVNLAVNARDAMLAKNPNGGGTVTIRTQAISQADVRKMEDDVLPVGDYTALFVSDTGTGIPPEALGKIFEPFFTTKEVGRGTGLGLSTVYGIIKQSGGYIFADSVPGEGTTFAIYLPVHAVRAGEKRPIPAVQKPKAGDLWGTGTILVVEDEDMVRAVAERALSRQGYTVLTAENGEAALEMIADDPALDLLVSDVVMPSMDGPTMAGHIRKRYPDLPILFMSGYAEEQLRKSIDIDNVAFLPKPFSVQQLAEAARAILAEK